VVKTSGGKGLHVYARLPRGTSYTDSKAVARTLAGALAARWPDRVVATRPTVSTPLTWDEVEWLVRTRDPRGMWLSPEAVVERLDRVGDVFAAALG
jgi:DNA primase